MDVAEFVAHYYYHDDTLEGVKHVQAMLNHSGVYFAGIPDEGLILMYLTVSDEGLEILKSAKNPSDFKNGFSNRLLQYPGKHIYVFRMVAENKPTLLDLRRLRTRIMKRHNATSFHWHDNDRVILHSFKG